MELKNRLEAIFALEFIELDSNHNPLITSPKTGILIDVPLSEIFGYATTLRSLTQGRGNYSMEFNSYSPVPKQIFESIIEKRQS